MDDAHDISTLHNETLNGSTYKSLLKSFEYSSLLNFCSEYLTFQFGISYASKQLH